MWLHSITAISLVIALWPNQISAETRAITPQVSSQINTFSARTNTPLDDDIQPVSLTSNYSKPLIVYQQALNHLLGRNGVTKSAEKAANLFKVLAEQNWSSAQHMLGNMYYAGKGVEKNDLLAYKWLSLASKNNLQLAQAIQAKRRHLHAKLQATLSSQSLKKVEAWIAEWKPSGNNLQAN